MPDESGSLVQLAGSERASLPDVTQTAPLNTQERAEITVVLRRRAELPAEIVAGPTVLSTAELAGGYGADPADVDRSAGAHQPRPGGHRRPPGHPPGQGGGLPGRPVQRVRHHAAAGQQPGPAGPGRVTHRYREGPLYVPPRWTAW